MSKRIFLIALLGGLLSVAAAYYPLYRWLPGQFVADWPAANERLALTGLALTLVLWLLTGAFAARQSGTRSRLAAVGAGALAGLIAAWLVEIALGGAAAGVWGSRLMLRHGIHATRDEAEFLFLLAHGVSSIAWGVYLSIWALGGLGALLGALGGWAAGPGGKPAPAENAFWLMVSSLVTPLAAASLLVMTATFTSLGSALQNATNRMGFALPYPAASAFAWPVTTHLVWLLFWQIFAWRLTRNAAPPATLRLPSLLGMALLLSVLLGFVLNPAFAGLFYGNPVAVLILLAVAALLNWVAARIRFPRAASSAPPTRLGNFLRQLGEARLAAWYFFVLSILTLALAVLIDRKMLTRHLWLPLGLGLGVLLGGLGVWETRARAPLEAESGKDAFDQKEFFVLGGLSSLFNLLFISLGTLAPFSLVLIPVVMIAPLSQHEEAAVQAMTTSTLPEMVQTSYSVSGLLLPALLSFALVYTLLLSAAVTLLEKWRNRGQASA